MLASCTKSTNTSSIKVVGEMRDVMWKGDLKGKIATDSLNNKETYGIGPIEFLKGEIVLFEGQTFVSKVIDSVSHQVTKIPSVRAPFFVYSTNSDLKVVELTLDNYSLKEIEEHIDSVYKNYDQPILIRIDGLFDNIKVHSVNLPEGKKVSSPEEAHQGLTQYDFKNISGSLIGFFSRNHKAVFTHDDSFFHAHFISDDLEVLGHIDETDFNSSKVTMKVSK
ncbi:acetolactate decarboxylase [Polaribacter tangerinus]|uniref:acetolactate decarboxylase n=1 Tax=Polaribacter tangerinus TaxID=1920034 RepID=UPI001E3764BB|nr:acetolactate decarboxylase [Polaribacter tangerinus]